MSHVIYKTYACLDGKRGVFKILLRLQLVPRTWCMSLGPPRFYVQVTKKFCGIPSSYSVVHWETKVRNMLL